MREDICTIPVSEVFEPKDGCPICRMRDTVETRMVEYIMGAAMMEPDVRVETNRRGFCEVHFRKMLGQKNRLSLALLLESRLIEIKEQVFDKKRHAFLTEEAGCFVCDKIEWGMERMLDTVCRLWVQEAEFRTLFDEQPFLCLPHYERLVKAAGKLKKRDRAAFCEAAGRVSGRYLKALKEDVSHYCKMYDYRNAGNNEDWGNSRDAVERTIQYLVARSVKESR